MPSHDQCCKTRSPARFFLLAGLLTPLALATPSQAGEQAPAVASDVREGLFLRLGAGVASYTTSGKALVMGMPIDSARIALDTHASYVLEAGWRFNTAWSASVLTGFPPTVTLRGRDSLDGFGEISKVTYGSTMLGVQYHPFQLGRFDPYVGGGLNHTVILDTEGGSLPGLRVKDSFGPILQVGFDMRISGRLSFYADFRKTWLDFRSKAQVQDPAGAYPINVKISPDPALLSFGLSYHF
jgi:outer membrane protein